MFISWLACADSDQDYPLSDKHHQKGPSPTKNNEERSIRIESDSSDDELKGLSSNTDDPSFTLVLNEANKIYLVSI